ncbi:serine/threonine-protein kinase [Streptomyces galilaeus]
MQLSVGGYVCERELGRGGQGVVWLARDRAGQQVVVKFLLPGKEYDEVALARVRREFGAASRVGELATARVLDADLTGRHPYIVSEFVPGPTIHQHVTAGGPLSSGRLQSLALAVAHALAQVHRAGVVHRDIKPSNILLSPDGPRIIDFGIARDDRLLESALTTPGSVLGSPAYMSPEQVKSLRVTSATDVFSLGGTLYFAATGRHPFEGRATTRSLSPCPPATRISRRYRNRSARPSPTASARTRRNAPPPPNSSPGSRKRRRRRTARARRRARHHRVTAAKAVAPLPLPAQALPPAEAPNSYACGASRPAAPRWRYCSRSCSAPPREDLRRRTARRRTAPGAPRAPNPSRTPTT